MTAKPCPYCGATLDYEAYSMCEAQDCPKCGVPLVQAEAGLHLEIADEDRDGGIENDRREWEENLSRELTGR